MVFKGSTLTVSTVGKEEKADQKQSTGTFYLDGRWTERDGRSFNGQL